MEEFVAKPEKKFRQRYAEWVLGIVAFVESSFFPIIVDPFLVGMTLVKTKYWFRFASIAVVASVLGGIFGYLIGVFFFDLIGTKIIEAYKLQELFARTVKSADDNAFLFTLIGAFTPLPYKLVVLVGGFLKINFFYFLLASIIGRSARFYIVGYITKEFGERALARYVKQLHILYFAAVIAVILYIIMAFI